jgi:type II restriction enzyme
MSKITEAKEILKALGLPAAQQNEMSALTLLALCNIKEENSWADATKQSMGVSKDIMSFVNDNYNKSYAPNTRETFRRQVLHQFVQGRIADYNPDKPDLPVNSPRAHYAISNEMLQAVKTFGSKKWDTAVKKFVSEVGALTELYQKTRTIDQIPLLLANGQELKLSPGKHNEVQVAIVEKFAARFAKGGKLLYLGDTAKKDLFIDTESLKELGIPIDQHSKLPDVVIFDAKRNWLFLIEAVTSHGPVSPKRIVELEKLLKDCPAGKVYVTAFPDISEYKKHANNIAWETEVWLADVPDHMIHFNGDRFMGPR